MGEVIDKKAEYSAKLASPKWQKKRLEIFTRDNWGCVICGDTHETLAVHHKRYLKSRDPWNYDNDDLMTVCSTCHRIIENTKKTKPDFDIAKVRSFCITDEIGAMSFYRYANNNPILIIKRGNGVVLSDNDIKLVMQLLKKKLDGKKIH